jgi:hypothetical protein
MMPGTCGGTPGRPSVTTVESHSLPGGRFDPRRKATPMATTKQERQSRLAQMRAENPKASTKAQRKEQLARMRVEFADLERDLDGALSAYRADQLCIRAHAVAAARRHAIPGSEAWRMNVLHERALLQAAYDVLDGREPQIIERTCTRAYDPNDPKEMIT